MSLQSLGIACFTIQLAALTAFAESPSWPDWNGPNENFAATPSGRELVKSLEDAKLIWQSEEIISLGKANAARSRAYSAGRHGGNQEPHPSGGGSSPIVAEGRVYLSYYEPNGDLLAQERNPKKNERYHKIEANEVVLCINAEDGKTLWKKVFPDGLNIQERKSPGYSGLTPVFADGRLYTIGTMSIVRCLNAATGELVWETPTPLATEELKTIRGEALQSRVMRLSPFLDNRGGKNLNFSDGVLLSHRSSDLIGFDGETGEVLWTVNNALGSQVSPIVWRRNDASLAIAINRDGLIRCIAPRTGKILWESRAGAPNDYTPSIEGDWLVAKGGLVDSINKRGKPEKLTTPAGFLLTKDGAEKKWSLAGVRDTNHWKEGQAAVHDGCIYLRVGQDNRSLICLDIKTGRVQSRLKTPLRSCNCMLIWADDRLLTDRDGSHMEMSPFLFDADPHNLQQLGEIWEPPHPTTTSYNPAMIHPVVDGRLYTRGADGIYCYDLRANSIDISDAEK